MSWTRFFFGKISKAKQNKELLLERAARFTHWLGPWQRFDTIPPVLLLRVGTPSAHRLEEHSCQVAIVVGATQTVCVQTFFFHDNATQCDLIPVVAMDEMNQSC